MSHKTFTLKYLRFLVSRIFCPSDFALCDAEHILRLLTLMVVFCRFIVKSCRSKSEPYHFRNFRRFLYVSACVQSFTSGLLFSRCVSYLVGCPSITFSLRATMPISTRRSSNAVTPTDTVVKGMTQNGPAVVSPCTERSAIVLEALKSNSGSSNSDFDFTESVIAVSSEKAAQGKKRLLNIARDDEYPAGGSKIPVTPKSKKTRSPKVNGGDTSKEKLPKLVAIPPPKDWLEIYSLVEELRKDRTAPCDHSGCEALPDQSSDPATKRFQTLISLMLSSQTKDAVVAAAIRAMQADQVLNVQSIHEMEPTVLQQYIAKVGFHNNKTKYIKEAVKILLEQFEGDIPRTADEMIEHLPGVGPKMAYICESVAWGTQSGIGVDTHMHRLFNMLHWVRNTSNPEKTRVQLESWLPKCYWAEVNLLWVGFGQEVQQDKGKILRKALACSRPKEALNLLKRCGLDYRKVGNELGIMDEVERVLSNS
jgi:endonuclease III